MVKTLIRKWLELFDIEAKQYHYDYFNTYYKGFTIRNRLLLGLCAIIIYISPLFLIGKFKSATALTNKQYYKLIKKLQYSNFTLLRVIPFFVHYPFISLLSVNENKSLILDSHPAEKFINKSLPKEDVIFDFIVVGSGAGGAPVAYELAKAGKSVCLIEKGQVVNKRNDLAYFTRDYYSQNSLDAAFSLKGATLISSGTSIGGTTSINLGTSLVPKEPYIKELESLLNLEKDELKSYFKSVIEELGIRESEEFEMNNSGKLMYDWAKSKGYDPFKLTHNFNSTPDRNIDFTYPRMINKSTDRYYLIEALKYNMKLLSDCKVEKIWEHADYIKIEIKSSEGKKFVYSKKLIISAGALNTPMLVKKNHLGNKWREAGYNFKLHPSTSVFAYSSLFKGKDRGIPQDIGFYDKKYPEILYEGVSLPREAKILTQMASTHDYVWWYKNAENVLGFGFLLKEEKSGNIFNLFGENIYNYTLSHTDVEKFEHGILTLAKAFFELGAEKVLLPIANHKNSHTSIESLNSLKPGFVTSRNLNNAGFHPSGTVGLGRLVKNDFSLHGSNRIYICDGSIIPDSIGVNPQLTIMTLSKVLAKKLLS